MRKYNVSIIVPTTCCLSREKLIKRALSSIYSQTNINVEIVVIVNGNFFDQKLFEQLNADSRLSVFLLQEGNVSKARYYGILQSKADYFIFLDDDDELLPNTLKSRIDKLSNDKELAVLVSNGFFFNGKDCLSVDDILFTKIKSSLVDSFLLKNWFASPAALYKKEKLDLELFDMNYKYFEMTYIFFKLLEGKYKIIFDQYPVYRCYEDTCESASKSESYLLAYPDMLKVFMNIGLPKNVKKELKRKYLISLNNLSNYFLRRGDMKKAVIFHIKCLLMGGVGYIFYTRKIFMSREKN